MAWVKVVWHEEGKVYSDTIPSSWVDETTKKVKWPVGIAALRAMNENRAPGEDWKEFDLLKIKLRSGIVRLL